MRKPTRFDIILGVVLTNSPHSVSDHFRPGLGTSYHNAVEFIVSSQQHCKVQHATVFLSNYDIEIQ